MNAGTMIPRNLCVTPKCPHRPRNVLESRLLFQSRAHAHITLRGHCWGTALCGSCASHIFPAEATFRPAVASRPLCRGQLPQAQTAAAGRHLPSQRRRCPLGKPSCRLAAPDPRPGSPISSFLCRWHWVFFGASCGNWSKKTLALWPRPGPR